MQHGQTPVATRDPPESTVGIVLTKSGLSTIVTAIVVARTFFDRMSRVITYRIAATLQLLVFLVFFFVAVLALYPGEFPSSERRRGMVKCEMK